MKKYKILMTLSILLFVSLFSLAFVNVVYLQVSQIKEDKKKPKELCSLVASELKFCTDKQKIIVTSKDLIILNFSFTNIGVQEIDVSKYDGGNYSFKVIEEGDKVVTTKLEQKTESGTMSDDNFKNFISSQVRNHRSVSLQPNEIYNEKIVLSDIYDFTSVGRYYVEITRKTRISNQEELIETPLGKIEIEVK